MTDMAEIAYHSVIQCGYPEDIKRKWLGEKYMQPMHNGKIIAPCACVRCSCVCGFVYVPISAAFDCTYVLHFGAVIVCFPPFSIMFYF